MVVNTNLIEDKWILLLWPCLADGEDWQDSVVVHLSAQPADRGIVLEEKYRSKFKFIAHFIGDDTN